MVFGLIALSTMVPTMIGLNQATQNTRDGEEERRDSARRQRCNLLATCDAREGTLEQRKQVQNAKVYLGPDGKVKTKSSSLLCIAALALQLIEYPRSCTSPSRRLWDFSRSMGAYSSIRSLRRVTWPDS